MMAHVRTTLWGVLASLLLMSSVLPAQDAASSGDEPLISLALVETDVRDALRLVAKQANVDIVLSSSVSGSVTLELDQATLTETLDAIMSVSGFIYETADSIVTVSTLDEVISLRQKRDALAATDPSGEQSFALAPGTEMQLFRLAYVDAERVRSLIEPLLSEVGMVSLLQTTDQMAQSNNFSLTSGAAAADLQIGGRLATSSSGQPATSHTLVVADTPKHLEKIAEIIQEIDVRPMQIQIEARFVEVALNENDKLGIDWNLVVSGNGGSAPHTFPFGNTDLGHSNPFVAGGSPGGVFPEAPVDISTSGAPGLFTFGTLDFTAFRAVLEMIQDDSRVQVVSNPRVLVRDRTTATILVGERFPILSTTVTDQGTVTEELDHYEPIGVQLEVTPSVLDDEQVELIVRPSTSTLGLLVEGSTGIEVARINTRQIDTSVIALDQQTVVLGGLISSRSSEVERRVPWLSAIPLIGRLFTSTDTQNERIDLVVFLTITIQKQDGMTANERKLFDSTDFAITTGDPADEEAWWSALDFSPSEPRY